MARVLDELVTLLALERIEENLFRGQSQNLGWSAVFGGQVLGQALSAAVQTVPGGADGSAGRGTEGPVKPRHVHSLHAYFLRPGDVDKPIIYDVDRIRDGGSFTTRRVVAIQNGKPILNMSASFQIDETGFVHQDEMPEVPPPESLPTEQERLAPIADRLPPGLRERARAERPFEIRTADPPADPFAPPKRAAQRIMWVRAVAPLPDDPALHRCLLAYLSDFSFVTTALLPHGVSWISPGMQVASIDHVMWIHQPFRCDEWLLHVMESPAAHGARGVARGRVFTQDGRLVATTGQEGLIRQHPPTSAGSPGPRRG